MLKFVYYIGSRLEDHDHYAKAQANSVGCPTEPSTALIECLRNVDAHKLTLTQPILHEFFGGTPSKLPLAPYGPRVGKISKIVTYLISAQFQDRVLTNIFKELQS